MCVCVCVLISAGLCTHLCRLGSGFWLPGVTVTIVQAESEVSESVLNVPSFTSSPLLARVACTAISSSICTTEMQAVDSNREQSASHLHSHAPTSLDLHKSFLCESRYTRVPRSVTVMIVSF